MWKASLTRSASKQNHMEVYDITAHITCVQVLTLHHSWWLRNPAACQLQWTFRIRWLLRLRLPLRLVPLLLLRRALSMVSQNHQRRLETHWWNEQVEEAAVHEKCAQSKTFNAMRKRAKTSEAKDMKLHWNEALGKTPSLADKAWGSEKGIGHSIL